MRERLGGDVGKGNGCEGRSVVGIPGLGGTAGLGGHTWDGGCEGDIWGGGSGGRTPTPVPWDIPSSPNTFPQWAQKKCSGCQVWSRAVRTFCRKRRGEVVMAAGGGVGGRGDTDLTDGAGAVGAARGEGLVVVLLAVCPPAPLKEGPPAQLLPAAGAGEVLGVPGLAQGREHLQGGGGAARAALGAAMSREERGPGMASQGLTLPAMGLRQVAQAPAGVAVMPSSCRSRVRLPSMLSSEGLGSAGSPAPSPAVAGCWEGGW